MKRFFFDTSTDTERDVDGTLLENAAEARLQGIRYAGEYLSSHPRVLVENPSFGVEVSSELGVLLFSIVCLSVAAPAGMDL